MKKVCCQLSPFSAHASTARPVYEPSSSQKRKSGGDMENERIRILLERQKGQILAEVRTKIQKHEFQVDSDGRSIQDLTWITDSQRREIDHAITCDEQSRRYQLLLQEQLSEQNRDLREALIKSLHEMEELKRFQGSTFDDSSRRRLIENQGIINELTARIQELQIEVNCMNDSRDFQDAESVRSGLSLVPSQPALFPLYRDPGRLLSRNDKPPDIWNTQGFFGKRFCKSTGVFFITLSRRIQSFNFQRNGRHITVCNEWTSDSRHSLGSEISVRTVSQKFIRP